MSDTEVLVVGAGVLGAWTAATLAADGFRVTLADRLPPGNARGSSGGESRTLRFAHGSDTLLTDWALRSSAGWEELDAGWHEPLIVRAGASWLLRGETDPRWETASARTMAAHGVASRWLSTRELEKMYSGTGIRGFEGALHEPEAALLYARRAVRAVVALARERGVKVLQTGVLPAADGRVRLQDGGELRPDHVVWACGPWLDALFEEVSIAALRQDIFYLGGNELTIDRSPLWLDRAGMVYGSGDLSGRGVKVNTDREFIPMNIDDDERLADPQGLAALRQYLRQHFPGLADRPVTGAETNQYEMSVNGDFIIDRLPREQSWWIVGGGSGQAFKHAPAIGLEVARQLRGNEPCSSRFSLTAPRVSSGAASVFG
jgi:glycine/D-amino acid oxidase-like deaminating enzyme